MPGHERERLTELEYEDYYSEALRILQYRYDSVGVPYRNANGERICDIETLKADDMAIFLLAFGYDVAHEIENGKPRYGEDIRETTLPQESQQMHAVSFTKGCYLGQEIVERIRAQGRVNKLLVRLEVDAAEPLAAGTKLTAGGAEAGEITSSAYSPRSGQVVALGYVRAAHAAAGTNLQAGELPAHVTSAQ